jgi:hypothetical protein
MLASGKGLPLLALGNTCNADRNGRGCGPYEALEVVLVGSHTAGACTCTASLEGMCARVLDDV